MSRWSESRQLPRNFLVTSWRLPRNICYGEVTGKLVPVEFELNPALCRRAVGLYRYLLELEAQVLEDPA